MIDSLLPVLVLALLAVPLTALATGRLIGLLVAKAIMDNPNARSSHSLPTPRGGGLAVMAVALPLWALALILSGPGGWAPWILPLAALFLVALSFLDDLRGLGPASRFLGQILCVAAGLAALPEGAWSLGGWLSPWLGLPIALLGWTWFVNLYNFMDGIDGITGVETASLGLGIALLALVGGEDTAAWLSPAPILVGAALGFLFWNWHRAKVFLGDSGSVPLGYLLGGLLLALAAQGQILAAVILPAYYLADATITLGRRALRGERVWQAHREHFYQKATRGGWSHDRVALWVAATNLPLLGLALWSSSGAMVGPLLGTVGVLVISLGTLARVGRNAPV